LFLLDFRSNLQENNIEYTKSADYLEYFSKNDEINFQNLISNNTFQEKVIFFLNTFWAPYNKAAVQSLNILFEYLCELKGKQSCSYFDIDTGIYFMEYDYWSYPIPIILMDFLSSHSSSKTDKKSNQNQITGKFRTIAFLLLRGKLKVVYFNFVSELLERLGFEKYSDFLDLLNSRSKTFERSVALAMLEIFE